MDVRLPLIGKVPLNLKLPQLPADSARQNSSNPAPGKPNEPSRPGDATSLDEVLATLKKPGPTPTPGLEPAAIKPPAFKRPVLPPQKGPLREFHTGFQQFKQQLKALHEPPKPKEDKPTVKYPFTYTPEVLVKNSGMEHPEEIEHALKLLMGPDYKQYRGVEHDEEMDAHGAEPPKKVKKEKTASAHGVDPIKRPHFKAFQQHAATSPPEAKALSEPHPESEEAATHSPTPEPEVSLPVEPKEVQEPPKPELAPMPEGKAAPQVKAPPQVKEPVFPQVKAGPTPTPPQMPDLKSLLGGKDSPDMAALMEALASAEGQEAPALS